ncbi:mini-chromosome maintenance complex-binding protein-like [Sycon ciliatum]|uniref:mini-chromosome maintenance complex-binding protein-like n=1 Tax=Sycon ciliatum TaxID=27933 RepID=UPI0031F6BF78
MPSQEGNILNDPLGVVRMIFERCRNGEGEFATELQKQVKSRILNADDVSWIPSLNDVPVSQLKGSCMVRYRGMIQDMFGPEIFLAQYELAESNGGPARDLCCGWYQDIADCPPGRVVMMESLNQVLGERQAFYCVPLPGETTWAKQAFASQSKVQDSLNSSQSSLSTQEATASGSETTSPTRKRGHADDEDSAFTGTAAAPSTGGEVTMGEDLTGESSMQREHAPADGDGAQSKRVRTDGAEAQNSTSADSSAVAPGVQSLDNLNFPLPGERGPPCIVKVYEDIESYRVNEMVEFVGVLSVDPALASDSYTHSAAEVGMDVDTAKEDAAHAPPPSIVPRLHCIVVRRLPHSNPLLPAETSAFKEVSAEALSNASACREELRQQFSALLAGDQLAAEYLLLHLVSTVYARHDASTMGKFSLNLSGVPRADSAALIRQLAVAIEQIVPKFYNLPMSLGHLNKQALCPKKDYSTNRLTTGQLQLSEGTVMLLDETALSEGQLNETGISNIVAINSVLSRQQLAYDFQYQTIDFPTNVNAIVVSEGKSILQVDCQVPLQATADAPTVNSLSAVQLNMLRVYLTAAQRTTYDLPEAVQKHLQEDFVTMRKERPETVTADTFHRLLLVARLLSISRGQVALDITTWNDAKQLEARRLERVAAQPVAPAS